ncbi:hypothetical protein EG347_12290 [Chryseobacterium sp. G0186]|uniref:hypothetical protein n=1 Tax=Chryseobacterium sp. G0186 TaxID=2487064 RepID=UPI000F4F995E|nr:hypothetical protein [Chryseobacterium sp. G0186]AZA78239.1 hypothetical protein EG347_12290 [Chryseobacterium sp. G0186]
MITLTQEKEIEHYLLSKNLNHQLSFEIKDHFIQQILTLMEEKKTNFQDAFTDAKLSWKQELEVVKADLFSFRKITKIEKDMLQKRFRNITVYSIVSALLLSACILMVSVSFMYFQLLLIGIMAALVGYNLIFRKMKLYNYLQLSFHPLVLKNAIVGIILFTTIFIFYQDLMMVGSGIMKAFFLYVMAVKIQLLYCNAKKTSVLI